MDPHMKEAMRRKLAGIDKGQHGKPTLDMSPPDANPHAPDMHDHDGDSDDKDYEKLNPSDRAPDLDEKGGDLKLADHSDNVTDDAGNLKHEDAMALLKGKGTPPLESKKAMPLGRKMNLNERANALKASLAKK